MTLRAFLAKRLFYTAILVLFVIVLNFLIFEAMPGQIGVVYSIAGQRSQNNNDQYNHIVKLYHLNESFQSRFVAYVTNLLTFNFGESYSDHQSVLQGMIGSGRLVNTLTLIGTSTLFSIVIGVFIGILISKKRGSSWDSFMVTTSLTAYSLPVFFVGIILILVFAITLGWFPTGNNAPFDWGNPNIGPPSSIPLQILIRLQYLFLPALTLTFIAYGGFLLLTRATMLETLSDDYITTARAKGLSDRVIMFKHAFKNASLPIVTATALSFGAILGGAIITETLFNWNGLGLWLFNSVLNKDYPVMAAMFYVIALSVIIANFISDIIYGIIDPRIRYE
jgi:peptide/nickel transport system permease protein